MEMGFQELEMSLQKLKTGFQKLEKGFMLGISNWKHVRIIKKEYVYCVSQ